MEVVWGQEGYKGPSVRRWPVVFLRNRSEGWGLENRRTLGIGVQGEGKGESGLDRKQLRLSNNNLPGAGSFVGGPVVCLCSNDGISRGRLTNVALVSLSFLLLQSGQDGSAQRPTPTRIPMSKGMKAGKPVVAAPGAGNLTKFEPRAETQSMKIELKKSAASSATSPGGGKG